MTPPPARRFVAELGRQPSRRSRDSLDRAARSRRAREGWQRRRRQGLAVGRPELDPATRVYVAALRADGLTFRAIAERLQSEGRPTARGGRWWASTVARIVSSVERERAASG